MLEGELSLQLDQPWRRVPAQARPERRSRTRDRANDRAELRARQIRHGSVEVRMVEDVVELEAQAKLTPLPTWNMHELHDRKVRVEVARSAQGVSAEIAEAVRRGLEGRSVEARIADIRARTAASQLR